MMGVMIGIVVLIVIGVSMTKLSKSNQLKDDPVTRQFQQMEERLWHSYVAFSIAKQNEIYALFLDEEGRQHVLETKQLPEDLVEAIRLFHEELNEELAEMQQLLAQTEAIDQPIVEAYIAYLEARNIFLNKEWGYTRAILKQDEAAITATRLYRKARIQQTAAYETFAQMIIARAKKLKVKTRFKLF